MSDKTKTFTDFEGSEYRAELIPAKVVFHRKAKGDKHESLVGNLDAEHVQQLAAKKLPLKDGFSPEILHNGAAPWALATAAELLGVKADVASE